MAEWRSFHSLIYLFCDFSGLEVSLNNSCFIFANVDEAKCDAVKVVMDCQMVNYVYGFKYLGFILKPSGYVLKHWGWLLKEIA